MLAAALIRYKKTSLFCKPDEMLVRTVQVNTFKSAIDSIKDILGEVTLVFHPTKGIILPAVDHGKRAFIHMQLEPSKFEIYDVKKVEQATFDISHLFRITKNAHAHGFNMITLSIESGALHVNLDKVEMGSSIKYTLRLVNEPTTVLDIPHIEYDTVLKMPTQELARYLRDINSVSTLVRITVRDRRMTLLAEGVLGKCEIAIQEGIETGKRVGVEFLKCAARDSDLTMCFPVKYLIAFCKAACLDPCVKLMLKEEMPLCAEFSIVDLGVLRYYLCKHAS